MMANVIMDNDNMKAYREKELQDLENKTLGKFLSKLSGGVESGTTPC